MTTVQHSAGQPGADRGSEAATGSSSADQSRVEREGAIGAYFCALAADAYSLSLLLGAEIGGGASNELCARLVAAQSLAQRIGYLADRAADHLGSGIALGHEDEWLLAPSQREFFTGKAK